MSIKAILEEKASAFAAHDGLIVAGVTHLIAAANEIVAEARREMDALIAGLAAPSPDATPTADEPVAEVEAPVPVAQPADAPLLPEPLPEPVIEPDAAITAETPDAEALSAEPAVAEAAI